MNDVCIVDSLCKTYLGSGVTANADLSMHVMRGEVLGVFGPNGAGKTTLVRQIMGLLRPSSGRILICGDDVTRRPATAPIHAAYHAQRPITMGSYTPLEVLVHAGVLRGMRTQDAMRGARALLGQFGLLERAGTLMMRLSGGERQMVLLLAVFSGYRPLVILDEPTSNLDPVRRRLVWEFLHQQAADGVSIILVTHNVAEADQAVHRAVVIDRGTVVASGTPGELKRMVSTQVEIRITLKPGAQWRVGEAVDATPIGDGRWVVRASQHQCPQMLAGVLEAQGLDEIDDFSLSAISMDSVYEALTGRWWDERHDSATHQG